MEETSPSRSERPKCLHCGEETEPLAVASDKPTMCQPCYDHLDEPGLKLRHSNRDEGTAPTLWVRPLVEGDAS